MLSVNSSGGEEIHHFGISTKTQNFMIFLYSVVIIVAVGGNGIVCYIVFAYKRMHTVPNYFIFNLACSDMMMAIFCIPFTFVANMILYYWPFGEAMCPIVCYVQVMSVFLSAYTLVAMSIDRYITVVHPFKRRLEPRESIVIICVIWVLALAIPLPTLLKSRIEQYANTSGRCLEAWSVPSQKYMYSTVLMILHYFAPLLVLLYSYARIGYTIWVKNIKDKELDHCGRRFQLARSKRKMIQMMVTVVAFYALCWLPLHTITLIGDRDPQIYDSSHMPIIWLCAHWLAMSNSCCNPIIYIWMNSKFRTGLKLTFMNFLCSKKKSEYMENNEDHTDSNHIDNTPGTNRGNRIFHPMTRCNRFPARPEVIVMLNLNNLPRKPNAANCSQ